jgi:hypothetical protein
VRGVGYGIRRRKMSAVPMRANEIGLSFVVNNDPAFDISSAKNDDGLYYENVL